MVQAELMVLRELMVAQVRAVKTEQVEQTAHQEQAEKVVLRERAD
jgi:hypothetical protein